MDFVVNRGMRRWYIQSAFAIPDAAKRLQEMRPFSKIPDSFSRIVIVKDDIKPWIDEHGVLTVELPKIVEEKVKVSRQIDIA